MKKSLGPKALALPTPAWLVGTYDAEGKANVAAVAWGGICSSQPPSVAVSMRRATATHGAIMARRAFTVNIPSERHLREFDYAGLISGRDADKFAATGLTPVGSGLVDAPYVAEFPVILECRLLKVMEVGMHTQFIAEIADVKGDEEVLDERGLPDAGKVRTFFFDPGSRGYFATGTLLGSAFSVGKGLAGEEQ